MNDPLALSDDRPVPRIRPGARHTCEIRVDASIELPEAGAVQAQGGRGAAVIEEAVQIRRALADVRPDAFLPDLAGSLNNQANALSGLGRRKDALAVIEEAAPLS